MMTKKIAYFFSACTILGVAALPLSYANEPAQTGKTAAAQTTLSASEAAQQKDTIQFVNDAANYIKQHGRDAAIVEFNKKDGPFVKQHAYIFAVDFNGIMLASPFQPNM